MFENPSPAALCALLKNSPNIAVVGLSPRPERPSFRIAKAMQQLGFTIIPVRPGVAEVLGQKAYPRLSDVPDKIDLVNVFRAAEHLDAIVDECLALQLPAIWIQEGIVNEAAAQRARDGGMAVVMDRCIWRDYMEFCL